MIDKPAMAERHAGLEVHAALVRAAMLLRLVHATQQHPVRVAAGL